MQYWTVNPATGERIDHITSLPEVELLAVAAQVRNEQRDWGTLPLSRRLPLFTELAAHLRSRVDHYAGLITLEMGKPVTEAKGEIEKCAWLCDVYADMGGEWLAEEEIAADGHRHRVVYQPLGVILSIMPWNFPFWQALRFSVPALLAGNGSILKHAGNVPRCAQAIETAFRESGFPPNLFRNVFADHAGVATLIADDAIAGISLTGSTEAGRQVAGLAGRHLKKVVLELGGSDPFIVLEDADIEHAARNAVLGRCFNSGQSCIAAKRFIVLNEIAAPFTERFVSLMNELPLGDPTLPATRIGPMVNAAAVEEIENQIAASISEGAVLACGGKRVAGPGFLFEPTVLTNVRPDMAVMREEVFGPVAPIMIVDDEEEALRVANDSEFGLGGSVWTEDIARGERLARRIQAGAVFVNSIVKSDPRMPFGGIKRSGLGRELSWFGLREFVNVQGVNVYSSRGG
ncbi:MAG: NAD-dependent succinate-semialdehyde dehydrogenase [bacterium]|nr:NAD-dependent succinate-semialdehyde dehydrogenase [bacterium]